MTDWWIGVPAVRTRDVTGLGQTSTLRIVELYSLEPNPHRELSNCGVLERVLPNRPERHDLTLSKILIAAL